MVYQLTIIIIIIIIPDHDGTAAFPQALTQAV